MGVGPAREAGNQGQTNGAEAHTSHTLPLGHYKDGRGGVAERGGNAGGRMSHGPDWKKPNTQPDLLPGAKVGKKGISLAGSLGGAIQWGGGGIECHILTGHHPH